MGIATHIFGLSYSPKKLVVEIAGLLYRSNRTKNWGGPQADVGRRVIDYVIGC
jgi:hypothetical protein